MTTSKEDAELMSRLRSKYSSRSSENSTAQGAAVSGVPSFEGSDSLARVHLCPICQGSGYKTEVYEFRRMQSNCDHCQGEGILTSGTTAARQSSKDSGNDVHGKAASRQQRQQRDTTAPGDKGIKPDRRKLERQLSRLQQKLSELMQEKADLQAAMVAEADSGDKQHLQQQLLDQLQQYISHLQELQNDTQDALAEGNDVGGHC